MVPELRNVSWDAVMKATVRVGNGSGVVIRNGASTLIATAEHVVPGDGLHRIKWPGGFDEQGVLARDTVADVAVLAAPPKLDAVALDVEGLGPQVGDDVIAAGFPDGWDEEHPLLARGAVAGLGAENWVNLDGTWGNSGGPLCLIVGQRPRVVGILRGRAGKASRDLDELRRHTDDILTQINTNRETVIAHERALIAAKGGGTMRAGASAFLTRTVDDLRLFGIAKSVLNLLDDHFRTGFLRFVAASELLRLLT